MRLKLPVLSESANLRYTTFFYLYIMQGVPAGFALTAIANYLLGKHVEPQQVGGFIAIVGIPWTVQFVWGPLIDRFQFSAMGHRKHWIVLSQLVAIIASLGLLAVHDPYVQLSLTGAMFFIHSVFASVQVASVDALAITIAPEHERGRLNGFMRGGFLLGTSFGAAVLSYVLHTQGFRTAALIQTGVLAFFSILFFFTKIHRADLLLPARMEPGAVVVPEGTNPDMKALFKRIYLSITNRKSLSYFTVVAIVYFFNSVFIRSYTYHLINVLHWPDKTVSLLQGSWGSIITFVAIIIAGISSDKTGAKSMQVKVMWIVCFFFIVLNGSFILWKYSYYSGTALVLWNLADPLLSVTIFPILMGLCWTKVEGSQFTTYLALINLCDVIGSYATGWALNSIPAPALGMGCGIGLLCVLLLLRRNHHYAVIPG